MRNIIITLSLILINIFIINAQPFSYSGYVYGANDQGLVNVPVSLYGKRIDPFEVTFPTYNTATAFNVGTVVPSSDDVTHGPFNIGFTFNFFGNNYTQFYIGSNGWIGFTAGQTTGYTAAYIPNAGSPKNVIMADWEDLFPGSANIYYTTIGTAPNRKLVVNFNAVPHYGCRSNLHTFQFVLYETTNVIDVNYASKPLCAGNNATAGLVNIDNTNVVPVGGKNASTWSVTNYSVRYTPSAAETTFSLKGTYLTNSIGYYSIVPNLDAQSYQFEVRLENLTFTGLTNYEARYPIQMTFNNTAMNSKLYYLMDINGDGRITVSDSYNIYGKMSGRFPIWATSPNYRIFTPAQWNVIKLGTTDLRPTYPGVQSMTITPVNGGSTNFYLIRTGFTN
ncbi:unannotated protein [freshwater metagenome]|uniref:Unannotated protein n=1 Tax=freshwater metagenome TaxID=449393 RepID=A0A6J7GHR2_9ZZZZ|nr:hypothetical protein [Actinomycetota bacterium]